MTMTIYSPDVVRSTVQFHIREATEGRADLGLILQHHKGILGATIGAFNLALSNPAFSKERIDEARHWVWGWVLSPDNMPIAPYKSQALTDYDLYALHRWVGAKKDSITDKWIPRESFIAECRWIYRIASMQQLTHSAKPMYELVKKFKEDRERLQKNSVGDLLGRDLGEGSSVAPGSSVNSTEQGGEISNSMSELRQQYGDDKVRNWKLKF